jgi:hypothetical protein
LIAQLVGQQQPDPGTEHPASSRYLWLYVDHGALQPVAGGVRDATGRPNAPAAAMVLAMLAPHGVFRYGMRHVRSAPAIVGMG